MYRPVGINVLTKGLAPDRFGADEPMRIDLFCEPSRVAVAGMLFLASLNWMACATVAATAPAADPDNVKMDPVVVQGRPEPVTGLDGYDAQQLLEVGNQKYANKAYDEAVEV
ncbi:MAG: hypothetical protein AAFN74_24395, partial [Myxococcota bacterium]